MILWTNLFIVTDSLLFKVLTSIFQENTIQLSHIIFYKVLDRFYDCIGFDVLESEFVNL